MGKIVVPDGYTRFKLVINEFCLKPTNFQNFRRFIPGGHTGFKLVLIEFHLKPTNFQNLRRFTPDGAYKI